MLPSAAMRRALASALVLGALASTPTRVARADVAPPPSPCAGKAIGERCAAPDGRSGTCRATTCTRFEHWKSPATTASYDCVQCLTEGDASAGSSGKAAKDASKVGCGVSRGRARPEWAPGVLGVVCALAALARRRGGEDR